MIKFKLIKQNNKPYLYRLAFYFKDKSIKIHLFVRDDKEVPHTHPWDFKSLLIIPYKEELYHFNTLIDVLYYKPFSKVIREKNTVHRVSLYKIFNISIPALTIGLYNKKEQLCSFCQPLGYCKSSKM